MFAVAQALTSLIYTDVECRKKSNEIILDVEYLTSLYVRALILKGKCINMQQLLHLSVNTSLASFII